ncbi:hypothetical protein TWF569_009677 [Orbilia oligospora]|uniref:Uncharacterized protein n=1 Tax=Orbilia oligospora TaxID=2813651 RepID=A0A7C8J7V7_ORBOL|nr:hypothetical protein TWF103_004012 [Orbilia oligospora]KAF3091900.1 hypothetical protein TWF102_008583 [Orbilia oligospora]KAF3118513.1 hypothetical protein TWF703_005090 [Orbilia oligospora]KAF3135330.1 hypothetical protein TWF594_008401 [Orbilia oligospora]KAF3155137.1 hypothetical protein TWF569_009677 [Orbilia oligospora]
MNTVSDFIRWSPHSDTGAQQFMTISAKETHVSLYNVKDFNNKKPESIRSELVFKKEKIPHIKCFDWSPLGPDLVAVGKSGGEALILRMKSSENAENSISLPVKHQRGCNSVAFSRAGFLAIGLDKVRNDFCLNIWDVNSQWHSGGQSTTTTTTATTTTTTPSSSVMPSTPSSLRGVSTTNATAIRQPQKQLAPSEMISAIQFFTDQPHVLVAGVGQRFLRAFDIRDNTGSPALNFPTRLVHGITIDRHQNYFSSCSEDGYMAIWDRRFAGRGIQDPALSFPKIFDDHHGMGGRAHSVLTIHSLRYARENSASFGVLGTNGVLNLYQMGTQVATPVSTEGIGGVAAVARFKDPSKLEADRLNRESLFVTKVSETPFKRPLRYENTMTSFDWISDGSSDPDLRVISLARNGGITAFTVPTNPISTAFGARNNFVMTDNENATVLNAPSTKRIHVAEPNHTLTMGDDHTGYNDEDEDDDESDSSSTPEHPLTANGNGVGGRGEVNVRRDSVVNPEDYMFDPRDTLRIDISVTMRRRAEWGYQFDCAKNEKLVTKAKKENELAEMWRWLDGAMECTEGDGMYSGGLDLSYLGVLGIWRPNLPASRLDPGAKLDEKSFSAALKKINDCNGRKGRFKFAGETKYPEQRILGLAMCGWDFNSDKDLEEALEKFEKKQQFEKAAGWALFHGNIERCIKALSMGKTEMKLMSTAVAGYNSHRMSAEKNGIAENTTWKDLCREMATHMDDPYSRAIFAYVSNGDWQDVLDGSTGLPIRERLGIALRFLEDDELSTYIDDFTAMVIRDGEPEGILLTGVTEKAIDLLQVYVNKTGDVQTAALVASFAVPKYFTDHRVDLWVDSYRELLDRWKFWQIRANFDIKRREISTSKKGTSLIEPLPRQIYVRCNFCDRKVAHRFEIPTTRFKDGQQVTIPVSQSTQANFPQSKAIVCPNCRKPLPRCAICLLYLGTPNTRVIRGAGKGGSGGGGGEKVDEMYDKWFNFCLICNHGSHAGHAKEWFSKHTLCPVPECECLCGVFRSK